MCTLGLSESKANVNIYVHTVFYTGGGGGRVGEGRVRQARKARATHHMHPLVAPSVWQAEVALAFNHPAIAVLES
jgi:hypothetical protein